MTPTPTPTPTEPRTLNLTITEPGMRRALQMFRHELADKAGLVDCIIDLAFSMGANCAIAAVNTDASVGAINTIRAERERLINDERL